MTPERLPAIEDDDDDLLIDEEVDFEVRILALAATDVDSSPQPIETAQFFVELQQQGQANIEQFSSKVSAETFATGLQMTSSILKVFGEIAGACGPMCLHALSSVGHASGSMSALGGLHLDGKGHQAATKGFSDFAKSIGRSPKDVLSGKYSPAELWSEYMEFLGHSLGIVFGFGMIENVIDMFFDCFLPQTSAA